VNKLTEKIFYVNRFLKYCAGYFVAII